MTFQKTSLCFYILIITLNYFSFSQVWTAQKNWNDPINEDTQITWWDKYSLWIENEVEPDTLNSAYKASRQKVLKINCADLIYGLQMYFAYMHQLPFSAKNMRYQKRGRYRWQKIPVYKNSMSNYDKIENKNERFFTFMRDALFGLETRSLATYDAYPINLGKIKAGDFYTWNKEVNGAITRHTYLVKKVYLDGTLDILASTQKREKKGLPPKYLKKVFPTKFARPSTKNRIWGLDAMFGLSRFRPAIQDWGIESSKLNMAHYTDYSEKQFALAKKGYWIFFKTFQKSFQKIKNNIDKLANKLIKASCTEMKDRVDGVISSEKHSLKIKRCMNQSEYDTYSSPVSDSGRILTMKSLYDVLDSANQETKEAYPETFKTLDIIFNENSLTDSEKEHIQNLCAINIDGTSSISNPTILNLNDVWKAIQKGNPNNLRQQSAFHYNPNMSRYRRWGIQKGFDKKCWDLKGYYGYED